MPLILNKPLYSSHIFKNGEFHYGLKTDKIFKAIISEFDDSFDVIESLKLYISDISIRSEIITTNQVWLNGYNYKHNYVVCYEMGDIFPKFGSISEFILKDDNSCLLILKVLETEFFDRSVFAYKVKDIDNKYRSINIQELVVHEAMEIKQNCNLNGLFVISRHFL